MPNNGQEKDRPRKRGGSFPKWESLARKDDGYLQVTVCGIEEGTARFKELFPNGKRQKVEWHRLKWRKYNGYALMREGMQIAHRCGVRDCGTVDHIIQTTRAVNEQQKYCRYIHYNGNIFIACNHEPKCIPPLAAVPLAAVDESMCKKIKML
jgi:hypothetical protein